MAPTSGEWLALLAAVAAIAFQLWIPPLIGMADSWDFERVLQQNGLAHASDVWATRYIRFFDSRYRIVPPADLGDMMSVVTSSSLAVRGARTASLAAGARQTFDIRFLSALYAVPYLLGTWLLLVLLRPLGWRRWLPAAALLAILTDVGHVAYFNSFYSEATALAVMPLLLACAGFAVFRPRSLRPLLGLFALLAILITAKPQYIPLLPAWALLGILSAWGNRALLALAAAATLTLAVLAGWYLRQSPPSLSTSSVYVGIFMDLLPHSSSPRDDLADLGLDPAMARYSGTTPYTHDSPYRDAAFRASFDSRVSVATLPRFYLLHPASALALMRRCAPHTFQTRVRRLGYWEESSGHPPGDQAFGAWSWVRERLPRDLALLAAYFASGLAAAVALLRRGAARRGWLALYACLVYTAAAQYGMALLVGGGEPDVAKHLWMFNLAVDASLVLGLAGAVAVVARRRRASP